MNRGAILLNDILGAKAPTGIGGRVKALIIQGGEQVNVLRGELVIRRPEEVPIQGGKEDSLYQSHHDPAVTMWCKEVDVAPLSEIEFQLLAAIKLNQDRHKIFVSGDYLDWGTRVRCGDHVSVMLPSDSMSSTLQAIAVVKYVGELPNEPGIQFGIEIKVSFGIQLWC